MRLESPTGDKKHNCLGVIFDGGITVVQKRPSSKGTCTAKFLVESPSITYERTRERPAWVEEATCVGIEGPDFDSNAFGDKTPGIEDAKTFPLANMNPPIAFIDYRVCVFEFQDCERLVLRLRFPV